MPGSADFTKQGTINCLNGGLGTNFTNEVLTYLIKKNLIKITLAMANGLEPPARMIIVSANEADKASAALLTCGAYE